MRKRNRHKKKKELKVGNSAVVKNDIKDVAFGDEMTGWQGRIIEVHKHDDGDTILLLEWDSITLDGFPDRFFENCEENGQSWSEYYISSKDVQSAAPRDTKTG